MCTVKTQIVGILAFNLEAVEKQLSRKMYTFLHVDWVLFRPGEPNLRPTNTSESLRPVTVSDSNHQWKEVDFTEPSSSPLHQATTTAGGNGPAAQPTITHKPLWPGLPTLQLVLTTTLQSQSQTLVTWRHRR